MSASVQMSLYPQMFNYSLNKQAATVDYKLLSLLTLCIQSRSIGSVKNSEHTFNVVMNGNACFKEQKKLTQSYGFPECVNFTYVQDWSCKSRLSEPFPVCVCLQVTWPSSCLWLWWESTATRWSSVDGTHRTCPSSRPPLIVPSHSGHTTHNIHTQTHTLRHLKDTQSP